MVVLQIRGRRGGGGGSALIMTSASACSTGRGRARKLQRSLGLRGPRQCGSGRQCWSRRLFRVIQGGSNSLISSSSVATELPSGS